MKRGQPMRRTPLRSGPPIVRLSKPRTRLRRERMDPDTRDAVYERSRGRCDFCGDPVRSGDWECHHRRLRSRGGADDLWNLICLHPTCHTAVHGMPAWSDAHGFTCPSWADPASWPVFRHRHRWQQPTPSGWVGSKPHEAQREAA